MQTITLQLTMASLSGMLLFAIWKKWQSLKLKRVKSSTHIQHERQVEREAEIRAWMQRNGHR